MSNATISVEHKKMPEHIRTKKSVENRKIRESYDEQLQQLYRVGQSITSEMNMDVPFEVIMEQTMDSMGKIPIQDPRYKFIKRTINRREADRSILNQNKQLQQLYRVGQSITSEMNMDVLFEVIMEQTNEIMDTERSTLFLYDPKQKELWSLVATGMGKNKIRVPADRGIAGLVFQTKKPLIIKDAYTDPGFNIEIDKHSDFNTRNILCAPILNRNRECIAVIQALNKSTGDFTDQNLEILSSIADYVAIALENSKLYEDTKKYSEALEQKLLQIEKLEYIKSQLTKFVPSSVTKLFEQSPGKATLEKMPMDVTILFIDIQGFSRITESHDPRIVNDMVERHFSRYLDCITRHGGEINETTGDGLMVIFKEDCQQHHAKAAVNASLLIAYENECLNNECSYPWGKVNLHLGINTGKALVGFTKMKSLAGERYTYTASGMATVLASRIGNLSTESRLYVGPDTFECVRDSCNYEYLGLRKVKNIEEAIPIYWIRSMIA